MSYVYVDIDIVFNIGIDMLLEYIMSDFQNHTIFSLEQCEDRCTRATQRQYRPKRCGMQILLDSYEVIYIPLVVSTF